MSTPQQLELVKKALRDAADTISALKKDKDALKRGAENAAEAEKIASSKLENAVRSEQAARRGLQAAATERAKLQELVESLRARLASVRTECQAKLQDAARERLVLQDRCDGLRKKLRSTETASASLGTEVTSLRSRVKVLERRGDSLREAASEASVLREVVTKLKGKLHTPGRGNRALLDDVPATLDGVANAPSPAANRKRHSPVGDEPVGLRADCIETALDIVLSSSSGDSSAEASRIVGAADSVAAWVRGWGVDFELGSQAALCRCCARVSTRRSASAIGAVAGLLSQLFKPRRLGGAFRELTLRSLAAQLLRGREVSSVAKRRRKGRPAVSAAPQMVYSGEVPDCLCVLYVRLCRLANARDQLRSHCVDALLLPLESANRWVSVLHAVAEGWPETLRFGRGKDPLSRSVELAGTLRAEHATRHGEELGAVAHKALEAARENCAWATTQPSQADLVDELLQELRSGANCFGAAMGLRLIAAQSGDAKFVHDELIVRGVWPLLLSLGEQNSSDEERQRHALCLVGALSASPALAQHIDQRFEVAAKLSVVLHESLGASAALRRGAQAGLRELGCATHAPPLLAAAVNVGGF